MRVLDLRPGTQYDHLTDALDEATVPVVAELRERLEIKLSEKDWLAIDTAVPRPP